MMNNALEILPEGILIVDKSPALSAFSLVSKLRRLSNIKKIGHAGTLDPFATGVMIMLIGSKYTKKSEQFLQDDKEYLATIHLGIETDTYDCEGTTLFCSDLIPSLKEIENALEIFQGQVLQVPPMFSAKKINGQRLYKLARKGQVIERQPVLVRMTTTILSYKYPLLKIKVNCSKGTYIRSLAHDLGQALNVGAHLSALQRTKSGPYTLEQAISQHLLDTIEWQKFLIKN